MVKTLNVCLYEHKIGKLTQDGHGQMSFQYAEDWLGRRDALPLSHSLPLQKEPFQQKQCRAFFAGVLPEATNREVIASNFGISARNDFAMLEKIGDECAGAVAAVAEGAQLPTQNQHYRKLNDNDLIDILEQLPRRPLMAGWRANEQEVRLSLAGAQDKLAVHVENDVISLPMNGAPSTHIFKPAHERFEGLVHNEVFCLDLAREVGLPVVKATVRSIHRTDHLLVQRYDRLVSSSGQIKRVHQEDFCQALGIVPETKYQSEGGPSLKQCFDLLRNVSSAPVIDLQHLLNGVIFNVLIGNNDAHGKNFSLLFLPARTGSSYQVRLAPFYDLICTTYYPELSTKMAMKIGGEANAGKLSARHFEKLAEQADFAKPGIRRSVRELTLAVMKILNEITPSHLVVKQMKQRIGKNCERLLEQFLP